MKHTAKFNKKLKEFFSKHRNNPTIAMLEAFKEREGIRQYHVVFLKLKFKLGIDYTTKSANGNYKFYIPYLKLNPDNAFQEASGLYPLRDQSKPFASIDECYTFLIGKLMDRISSIHDLDEYLDLG
ncbi:MAG: hypothetical protein HRU41_11600 [Saprospiraceae bacterium]|nr:hypothetical protein [Saprospiraceae bacterium]